MRGQGQGEGWEHEGQKRPQAMCILAAAYRFGECAEARLRRGCKSLDHTVEDLGNETGKTGNSNRVGGGWQQSSK